MLAIIIYNLFGFTSKCVNNSIKNKFCFSFYTMKFVALIASSYPHVLYTSYSLCSKIYINDLNIKICRCYTKRSDTKEPSKEEQIDSVKMPGFVHPQTMHEEGYFAQKAKQQIEELKKRLDKPTADSSEKKE